MSHDLTALLDKHGLARVRDAILAASLPSIRMRAKRVNEMEMAEGASKIGGLPDLPPGTEWPVYRSRPLSFLAQINLAEVQSFPAARQLPAHGLLSFFYDAVEQPWGFDPADEGRWRVLYFPNASQSLERTEWPEELDDEGRFDACAVSFEEDDGTMPPLDSRLFAGLEFSDDERHKYVGLLSALEGTQWYPIHRLLGHPETIQNDMQTECALVTNGVYLGGIVSYDDPKIQLLLQGYRDWLLLFQLDSEDDARMMWGDVGRLYFWIRATDLEKQNFDACWLVLQCT